VRNSIIDNFLAYKADDGWKVVYRGDGYADCSEVQNKDFPTGMIDDCFNPSKEVGIVFNSLRNNVTATFSEQYATDFEWSSTGYSISRISKLSGLAMDTTATEETCDQLQKFFYDQGFMRVFSDETNCNQDFQKGNLVCIFKPLTKSEAGKDAEQVVCGELE